MRYSILPCAVLLLWTSTAGAEERTAAAPPAWLDEMVRRGLDIVEDYMDIEGRMEEDATGRRIGRLRLRVYPNGKASDDAINADADIEYGGRDQDTVLRFRFRRLSPPAPLPDNVL